MWLTIWPSWSPWPARPISSRRGIDGSGVDRVKPDDHASPSPVGHGRIGLHERSHGRGQLGNDGQAEAGALAAAVGVIGGEVPVEYPAQLVGRNARSIVDHPNRRGTAHDSGTHRS